MGPLSGLTVVAIEQAVAAPFATSRLADAGARVIKIERPGAGDFARGYDETVHGESSYFVWLNRGKESLVADIKAPSLELRRTILQRKLADLPGARVPANVLDLLAGRITGSIRELEGALNRVVAYAQLTGETIDLDFAVATLGDVLRGAQRRVTIDEIQKLVSAHFDLKPVDLVSARRARAALRSP